MKGQVAQEDLTVKAPAAQDVHDDLTDSGGSG